MDENEYAIRDRIIDITAVVVGVIVMTVVLALGVCATVLLIYYTLGVVL